MMLMLVVVINFVDDGGCFCDSCSILSFGLSLASWSVQPYQFT